MGARCQCAWRLLFFLALLLAEARHGSSSSSSGVKAAAAAADALPRRLPSAEARTLRRIAANMGISHWNFYFSDNPRESNGNLGCDCSFNNKTICHATEIFLKEQNFTGQLPPDFADLPHLLQRMTVLDLDNRMFLGWSNMAVAK